ncbi:MAG: ABC transporter permease [Blastocatellia bacterium]
MRRSQHRKKGALYQRAYRILLLVYPLDFRVENREEMSKAFSKLLQEEAVRNGRIGAIKLWLRGAFDVLWSAAGLRMEKLGRVKGRGIAVTANTGPGVRYRGPMQNWSQDLRYSIRSLTAAPGFAISSVIVLALGIGANTAIFSVVNGVLLRPLPYRDADEIVSVGEYLGSIGRVGLNIPDFKMLGDAGVFDVIAGYDIGTFNLVGGAEPVNLAGAWITSGMFRLFGVKPIAGRIFLEEEYTAGHGDVIILSEELWRREFGADPGIVGKSIQLSSFSLNGRLFNIVGVMPRGFQYPKSVQFWMPEIFTPAQERNRANFPLSGLARVKPGASAGEVRKQLASLSERLVVPKGLPPLPPPTPGRRPAAQQYQTPARPEFSIRPIKELVIGDSSRLLLMLIGAAGFVLAIGCANIANLLLARGKTREYEMAVRAALGSGRWHLIRELLTESLILSTAGGAFGLLISYWVVKALVAGLSADKIPRLDEVVIDCRVLCFTLALSLLAGLLFGLAPAIRASRPDLIASLKDGAAVSGAGLRILGRGWFRGALVVTEIALTLMLLVGAGLMLKSFYRLLQVKPGFEPNGVLDAELWLSPGKYRGIQRQVAFYDEVLERVKGIGGVNSAAIASSVPLTGRGGMVSIEAEGHPRTLSSSEDLAYQTWPWFAQVSPGYFGTVGMPLIAGRDFAQSDSGLSSGVTIVSKSFVDRFWPGQNPLGKFIGAGSGNSWTVIGVVGDVKVTGLDEKTSPGFYLPYWLSPDPDGGVPGEASVVVKFNGDPLAFAPALRSQIRSVDKDQPIERILTLNELVSQSKAPQRLRAVLLAGFAGLALILASTGVYGVVSYSVSQCTKEIGIRIALGATADDVARMAIRLGLSLVAIGTVTGIAGSVAMMRIVSAFLFEVSPHDSFTLIVAPSLLAVVALGASYIPARRAANVDPIVALKYE